MEPHRPGLETLWTQSSDRVLSSGGLGYEGFLTHKPICKAQGARGLRRTPPFQGLLVVDAPVCAHLLPAVLGLCSAIPSAVSVLRSQALQPCVAWGVSPAAGPSQRLLSP